MKQTIKSYEDYIESEMINCTYNCYNKLQTVGAYEVGNTCKVIAEWCKEIRRFKCRIISFQKNGHKIFAKIRWLSNDPNLSKKYGTLWSLDELVKV